jgi:hypothetical protein
VCAPLSSLHRQRISAASCAFPVEICDHISLVPRRHRVVRGEGRASALLISVLEACWRFIGNIIFFDGNIDYLILRDKSFDNPEGTLTWCLLLLSDSDASCR